MAPHYWSMEECGTVLPVPERCPRRWLRTTGAWRSAALYYRYLKGIRRDGDAGKLDDFLRLDTTSLLAGGLEIFNIIRLRKSE